MDCIFDDENALSHYGVGHEDGGHSGRYPWGSGEQEFKNARDFYDRVNVFYEQGYSKAEVAKLLKFNSINELDTAYSISKDEKRTEEVDEAKRLKDQGYGATEIGKILGEKFRGGKTIGESTIRSYLEKDSEVNMRLAVKTADELQKLVDKYNYVDVGEGSELYLNNGLGITESRLNKSLNILHMRGYEIYNFKTEQVTNPGRWTTIKALCKPGTTYQEVYKAAKDEAKLKSIFDFSSDITSNDGTNKGFIYPKSMDPKRLLVRSAEDGGLDKDGLAEIRPGVKDLSLGGSNYSQVRILVDGGGGSKDYYIKGMAVYGDPKDFPDGVDVIFNTNKPKEKLETKGALDGGLKSVKKNLDKDPSNPFGSAIKEVGGQSYYDDPNGEYINKLTGKRQSLSLINKRSDEGDWDEWAKKLPSQFLGKQNISLTKRQLSIAEEDKEQEYKEIMSLTNPSVKKKLLEEFASGCDSDAVHLQAAALPGQSYKVIIPIPSLKDNEVYAPHLENGTKVALIRFPHGGLFEIPVLKVNNLNQEGQKYLSTAPTDAVGINRTVAAQLSGADFDGDTVMVIPFSRTTTISAKKPLEGLKDFDTNDYGSEKPIEKGPDGKDYGYRNGHKYPIMSESYKQQQMGVASNLITDMTLGGATDEELEKAVKFSMVVIDAVKHELDYQQCEKDCDIRNLKKKYQMHADGTFGGASTLLSRAKSKAYIPERKEGAFFTKDSFVRVDKLNKDEYVDPISGTKYNSSDVKKIPFDPKTGEKVYTETGRKIYTAEIVDKNGRDKKVTAFYDQKRNVFYYKDKVTKESFQLPDDAKIIESNPESTSTKMEEASDARELISIGRTQQELAYAEYANKLKALANSARKESYFIELNKQDLEAKAKYKEERDSIEYKMNQAIANKPKERLAQILAGSRISAKLKEDPSMDTDHKNKLRQRELFKARLEVGAARKNIELTDKEWEAIQSGGIAPTTMEKLVDLMDSNTLKQLAMPRDVSEINSYKATRMRSMANAGYTQAEIARYFGISASSVSKAINSI